MQELAECWNLLAGGYQAPDTEVWDKSAKVGESARE
jgi:hypothetical protein